MVSKKEQIIQELSEKNIIDCQTLAGGNLWGYISRDSERLEVKNAIFENVKRYNEGWIIKENVCVFALYIGIGVWSEGKVLGFNWGWIRVYHTLLVYQPVPIKYDKEGEIIWDYRYQHELDTFDEEQKAELRQIIMNNQLNQTSQAAATTKQRTISPPISFTAKLFSILIISLSFIIFIFCWKQGKQRKRSKIKTWQISTLL
jgi:hypothetical protein